MARGGPFVFRRSRGTRDFDAVLKIERADSVRQYGTEDRWSRFEAVFRPVRQRFSVFFYLVTKSVVTTAVQVTCARVPVSWTGFAVVVTYGSALSTLRGAVSRPDDNFVVCIISELHSGRRVFCTTSYTGGVPQVSLYKCNAAADEVHAKYTSVSPTPSSSITRPSCRFNDRVTFRGFVEFFPVVPSFFLSSLLSDPSPFFHLDFESRAATLVVVVVKVASALPPNRVNTART